MGDLSLLFLFPLGATSSVQSSALRQLRGILERDLHLTATGTSISAYLSLSPSLSSLPHLSSIPPSPYFSSPLFSPFVSPFISSSPILSSSLLLSFLSSPSSPSTLPWFIYARPSPLTNCLPVSSILISHVHALSPFLSSPPPSYPYRPYVNLLSYHHFTPMHTNALSIRFSPLLNYLPLPLPLPQLILSGASL